VDIVIPSFEFSPERQFHCLRHFLFDDLDQVFELHRNFPSFHTKEIKEQLDMVGSKFNKEFALQPIDILNSLPKASFTLKDIERNKVVIQFSFSSKYFPNGIGNSALICLSELSVHQQTAKYMVNRSNYEVWSCDVTELPKSNILSIIEYNQGSSFDIITLFPGDYSPAFPRGTSELDEVNQLFWEEHCLLSKNSNDTR
jgi:hypothetical protein